MSRGLVSIVLAALALSVAGGPAVSLAASPAKKAGKVAVTLKVSPAMDGTLTAMGKTCKATCTLKVKSGSKLKITEKPTKKHKFQHWVVNGSMMGKKSSTNLKVTKKSTVEAVYK